VFTFGASVAAPPCIRQRSLAIAGDTHAFFLRAVPQPHSRVNDTPGPLRTLAAHVERVVITLPYADEPQRRKLWRWTERQLGRIRNAFIPREGWTFVSADYSQIELVVLAHLSDDPGLKKAFADGIDVHRHTGSLIFGVPGDEVTAAQRRIAKTINFGVMYGMSAFRLARELGIPRRDAASFIEAYFTTYSRIKGFIDETVARAEETGYVETILGRKRYLANIANRNNTVKQAAERVAVNTPIQGSAADIMKKAMIELAGALRDQGFASRLLLQVHDELILECPPDEVDAVSDLVRETMVSTVELSIPLKVSVETGSSWGEMH